MNEQIAFEEEQPVDRTVAGRVAVVGAGLFFVGLVVLLIWGIGRILPADDTAPGSDAPSSVAAEQPSSVPPSVTPSSAPAPKAGASTPTQTGGRAPISGSKSAVVIPKKATPPKQAAPVRSTPAPIRAASTGPETVGFSRPNVGTSVPL